MSKNIYNVKDVVLGFSLTTLLLSGIWCWKSGFDFEPVLAFTVSLTGVLTTFESENFNLNRLYKYLNYHPDVVLYILKEIDSLKAIKIIAYKYGFVENGKKSVSSTHMFLESPIFLGKQDIISVNLSPSERFICFIVRNQEFLNDVEKIVKKAKMFESVEYLEYSLPSLEHSRIDNLITGRKYKFPIYKNESKSGQIFITFETTCNEIEPKSIEFRIEVVAIINQDG